MGPTNKMEIVRSVWCMECSSLIVEPRLRINRSASIDDSGGARRVILLHVTACSSVPFNPGDHGPAAALSGRRAVATGRCEYTSAIRQRIENQRAAMLFLPSFHVLRGVFSGIEIDNATSQRLFGEAVQCPLT